MNITPSMLYWLTRLDEISCLVFIVCIAAIAVGLVFTIGGFVAWDSAATAKIYEKAVEQPASGRTAAHTRRQV